MLFYSSTKETKKWLLLFAIATLLNSCFFSTTPDDDPEEIPHYYISVRNEYTPFSFAKEENNGKDTLIGIDIEIINAIAKEENFTYTLVPLTQEEQIGKILNESIDGALNTAIITDQTSYYDFSIPYYESEIEIAIDSSNTAIKTIYDLDGKNMAVIKGSFCEDYISSNKQLYGIRKIISIDGDIKEMTEKLLAKEFDCCLLNVSALHSLIQQGYGIKVLNYPISSIQLSLSVKKNCNHDLLTSFNRGLAKISSNGIRNMIIERYDTYKEDVDYHILIPKRECMPFLYYISDSIRTGIEIDIMNAIAADQGFKYDIIPVSSKDDITDILLKKEADAAIGSIAMDQSKLAEYDFSIPYYTTYSCIIVEKKDSFIQSINEISQVEVAVEIGTNEETYVTDYLRGNKIFSRKTYSLSSLESVIDFVLAGNSRVVFMERTLAEILIEQGYDIKIVTECQMNSYALTTRKGEKTHLITMFNTGLSNIINNGSYEAIIDKHINFAVSK